MEYSRRGDEEHWSSLWRRRRRRISPRGVDWWQFPFPWQGCGPEDKGFVLHPWELGGCSKLLPSADESVWKLHFDLCNSPLPPLSSMTRVYSGVGRRFVGHSGGGIKIIRLEEEDYIFNEGNKNGAGWIVDRGGVFVRLSSVYSVARRFEQGGGKRRSKRRSMLQLIGW